METKRALENRLCTGCNASEIAYEDIKNDTLFCSPECQKQHYLCTYPKTHKTPWGIIRSQFYASIASSDSTMIEKYHILCLFLPISDVRMLIVEILYKEALQLYLTPDFVIGNGLNVFITGVNNLITVLPSDDESLNERLNLFINLPYGSEKLQQLNKDFYRIVNTTDSSLPPFTLSFPWSTENHALKIDYDPVTKKFHLWSKGNNRNYGSMGHGSSMRDLITHWAIVNLQTEPYEVAFGDKHALLIDREGFLWGTGTNENHQLGCDGSHRSGYGFFTPLPIENRCISVAVSDSYSAFITIKGELWMSGQFWLSIDTGARFKATINTVFTRMKDLPPVSKISCGRTHCVVITTEGNLWVMGSNTDGQLGFPPLECCRSDRFIEITYLTNVISVYCYDKYTIVTCADGTYWVAGSNMNGILGLDTSIVYTTKFTEIDALPSLTPIIINERMSKKRRTEFIQ